MNTIEIGTETSLVGNFIDGRITASDGGSVQDIFNHTTGRKSRSVVLSSAADVDAAVKRRQGCLSGLGQKSSAPAPRPADEQISGFGECA